MGIREPRNFGIVKDSKKGNGIQRRYLKGSLNDTASCIDLTEEDYFH